MKPSLKVGLMMLSVAVVAFGSSFALATPAQQENTENGFLKGHVELTVKDEDGNITAYRQSDNAIVRKGMEILAVELFNGVTGLTSAPAGGPLTHIQIGTGGETAPAATQTGIQTAITNCDRVAVANAAADASGDPATITVTTTATFDASVDNDCATSSIDEAGLFNELTGGEMFARNIFTAVTLTTSDSLDISWTFTFTDS